MAKKFNFQTELYGRVLLLSWDPTFVTYLDNKTQITL